MSKFKSSLAVPMVTVLFLTTLCATGAMTVYRVSSAPDITDEPWQVIPPRVDNTPVVAPRPKPDLGLPATETTRAISFPTSTVLQARLASDGLLPGRLNMIDPATRQLIPAERVTLNVVQNGKVVTYVKPGIHGVFQVPGLQPGVYSIVVVGDHGLLTYAVHVLPPADNPDVQTENSLLQIDSSIVLQQDLSMVHRVLSPRVPDPSLVVKKTCRLHTHCPCSCGETSSSPGAETPILANAVTPALAPVETPTLADMETEPARELRPIAKWDGSGIPPLAETPVRKRVVTLLPDGRVVGRLWQLDPQTAQVSPVQQGTVTFIRDGSVAGRADLGDYGEFEVLGLRPGVYSVVVAGEEGFAAFGVDVQEASPAIWTVGQGQADSEFVSTRSTLSAAQAFTLGIDVALTSYADFNATQLGSVSSGVLPWCCEIFGVSGGGGGGGWLIIPPVYWDDDDDPDPKSPFDPFYRTPNGKSPR